MSVTILNLCSSMFNPMADFRPWLCIWTLRSQYILIPNLFKEWQTCFLCVFRMFQPELVLLLEIYQCCMSFEPDLMLLSKMTDGACLHVCMSAFVLDKEIFFANSYCICTYIVHVVHIHNVPTFVQLVYLVNNCLY